MGAAGGDAPASAAAATEADVEEEDLVEAETALFESFTAVPSMAGAVLARAPDAHDDDTTVTLHVTTTQRDLAANRVRRSAASLSVPTAPPTADAPAAPLKHPAFGVEERGVVLSSISPSGERRMVVRGGKDAGGDRDGVVVEVWSDGALVTEVLVPVRGGEEGGKGGVALILHASTRFIYQPPQLGCIYIISPPRRGTPHVL